MLPRLRRCPRCRLRPLRRCRACPPSAGELALRWMPDFVMPDSAAPSEKGADPSCMSPAQANGRSGEEVRQLDQRRGGSVQATWHFVFRSWHATKHWDTLRRKCWTARSAPKAPSMAAADAIPPAMGRQLAVRGTGVGTRLERRRKAARLPAVCMYMHDKFLDRLLQQPAVPVRPASCRLFGAVCVVGPDGP